MGQPDKQALPNQKETLNSQCFSDPNDPEVKYGGIVEMRSPPTGGLDPFPASDTAGSASFKQQQRKMI